MIRYIVQRMSATLLTQSHGIKVNIEFDLNEAVCKKSFILCKQRRDC